ncbi:MAG: thioesterase family protein [Pseudomonadota bacterium]
MTTSDPAVSPFRRAVAWQRDGDTFSGGIDAAWAQGRATYGGLVAAGALGAMQAVVAPARLVRSLLVNYVGPVEPGVVNCRVELLRAGKGATQALARIEQQGQVRLLATAVFGESRTSTAMVEAPDFPVVTPVDELPDLPFVDGLSPAFTRYFRYRWGRGSLPFFGGDSGDMGGHLRFVDEVGSIDAQIVLGILDAWPAPVMSKMQGPARGSTMSWAVDFVQPLPEASADGWWSYAADTVLARDGYASHHEWLRSPQGQLVARGNQVVAVFG